MLRPGRAGQPEAMSLRSLLTVMAVALGVGACGSQTTATSRGAGSAPTRSAASASGIRRSTQTAAAASVGDDWPQFGYTDQRSNDGPAHTGITAANVSRLTRRVVSLPGTVDSSPIELNDVTVKGHKRDVVVLTTSYGRTVAINARTGARLWQFAPSDVGILAGTPQFTNASPTADPDHRYVYASTPDGRVHKLSLATGREVRSGHWPARVTLDPSHEKLASPPSIDAGHLIVVTDGYIGDIPPYQGHVVEISRATGQVQAVFNSLCSNVRHLMHPSRCPAGGLLYIYDQTDGALIVRSPRTGRQLASLPAGQGHWNTPIIADSRVFLPTGNANDHTSTGTLDIFHLPGH